MQFLIEAFTLMTAKNSPFIPLSRIKNRILIWVLVHDCLLGTLTPPGWVNCKWQPLFSTVTSCLCWAQISYVTIFKQRRLVCLRVGVGRKVCSAYCWRCTFLRAANSSSSVSVCFFFFFFFLYFTAPAANTVVAVLLFTLFPHAASPEAAIQTVAHGQL